MKFVVTLLLLNGNHLINKNMFLEVMCVLFINISNSWWELYKERMMIFNYEGGYHHIDEKYLSEYEVYEYKDWRELYLAKHFCPLEVDAHWKDVWVSPDGKFYNGEAHECRAEDILEIVYGEVDVDGWFGDRLEELGWVRATTSLMWEVRFDEWKEKRVTQKQYDALFDWCELHKKKFPTNVNIV